MFRDRNACCCGDKGDCGRDIECRRAIAARAAGVDAGRGDIRINEHSAERLTLQNASHACEFVARDALSLNSGEDSAGERGWNGFVEPALH